MEKISKSNTSSLLTFCCSKKEREMIYETIF